jgi:hypothetical protein
MRLQEDIQRISGVLNVAIDLSYLLFISLILSFFLLSSFSLPLPLPSYPHIFRLYAIFLILFSPPSSPLVHLSLILGGEEKGEGGNNDKGDDNDNDDDGDESSVLPSLMNIKFLFAMMEV